MADPKVKKKKKKKAIMHASYNQKEFLAKNDMMSMAAIRTRITPDGIASIWIADCNGSIRLWNDLNQPGQINVMLEKLDTLMAHIDNFRADLVKRSIKQYP